MDHELFIGQDETTEFLLRRYDDGGVTLSTRPLGGMRWTPEVALTLAPAEVCS